MVTCEMSLEVRTVSVTAACRISRRRAETHAITECVSALSQGFTGHFHPNVPQKQFESNERPARYCSEIFIILFTKILNFTKRAKLAVSKLSIFPNNPATS